MKGDIDAYALRPYDVIVHIIECQESADKVS